MNERTFFVEARVSFAAKWLVWSRSFHLWSASWKSFECVREQHVVNNVSISVCALIDFVQIHLLSPS
jgi:hypothetical protein